MGVARSILSAHQASEQSRTQADQATQPDHGNQALAGQVESDEGHELVDRETVEQAVKVVKELSGEIKDRAEMGATFAKSFDAMQVAWHLDAVAVDLGKVEKVANLALFTMEVEGFISATDGVLAASRSHDRERTEREMRRFMESLSGMAGYVPHFGEAYSSALDMMTDNLVEVAGILVAQPRVVEVCGDESAAIGNRSICEANGIEVPRQETVVPADQARADGEARRKRRQRERRGW